MKFIALCVTVVFSLSGCGRQQDQSAWWAGEQERVELSHALELQKFRYAQVYTGDFAALASLHTESQVASARVVSLRRERERLRDLVDSQQDQLAEFRESTLRGQRQRAMHQTFETLCSASGRKFEQVSISSIDDSGVTIRHTHGSARLGYSDLDSEQQRLFGLEADLALVAHEKEARDTAAYERWISERMESTRLNEATVAAENHRHDSATLGKLSDSPAPQIVASNVRPLRQPAKSFGSSRYRSYHRSYDRNYYPAYRYVYYDTPSCGTHPITGITVYPPVRCPTDYFRKPTVTDKHLSFFDTTIPSTP